MSIDSNVADWIQWHIHATPTPHVLVDGVDLYSILVFVWARTVTHFIWALNVLCLRGVGRDMHPDNRLGSQNNKRTVCFSLTSALCSMARRHIALMLVQKFHRKISGPLNGYTLNPSQKIPSQNVTIESVVVLGFRFVFL